jgi:SAM-dependent methyltransferase
VSTAIARAALAQLTGPPRSTLPATLCLGCGFRPLAGALNHDRTAHAAHVDVAHDLDVLPWPWPDGAFAKVVALDVVEHLRLDVADWLGECWRLLAPGGRLVLRAPAWNGPNLWRDPTHRRAFHEETFDFFDPERPFFRHGRLYFADYYPGGSRWWAVEVVERTGPCADLGFVLRTRGGG